MDVEYNLEVAPELADGVGVQSKRKRKIKLLFKTFIFLADVGVCALENLIVFETLSKFLVFFPKTGKFMNGIKCVAYSASYCTYSLLHRRKNRKANLLKVNDKTAGMKSQHNA